MIKKKAVFASYSLLLAILFLNASHVNAYCTAAGGSNYEWIDQVTVDGSSHRSGKLGRHRGLEGYSDFTSKVLQVTDGMVSLKPGFYSGAFRMHWTIWIDLNENGKFDSSERVLYRYSSSKTLYTKMKIPQLAKPVRTRMRVAMRYGKPQDSPCGKFKNGEVEDYTILFSGPGGKTNQNNKSRGSGRLTLPNSCATQAQYRQRHIKNGQVICLPSNTNSYYAIPDSKNYKSLAVSTQHGRGDLTLQVKNGRWPSKADPGYQSRKSGNSECVVIKNPAKTWTYITASGNFSGASLVVDLGATTCRHRDNTVVSSTRTDSTGTRTTSPRTTSPRTTSPRTTSPRTTSPRTTTTRAARPKTTDTRNTSRRNTSPNNTNQNRNQTSRTNTPTRTNSPVKTKGVADRFIDDFDRNDRYSYNSVNILVYRFEFRDANLKWTKPQIEKDLKAVAEYYRKQSYGRFNVTWDLSQPTFFINESKRNYDNDFHGWVKLYESRINQTGVDPKNPGPRNIIMVTSPQIGNFNSSAGPPLMKVYHYSPGTVAHEIGHALGLRHAKAVEAGRNIIGSGDYKKESLNYGNVYSMMGMGASNLDEYNLLYKHYFNWITKSEVPLVTKSGTYRIYAFDQGGIDGNIGLRIKSGNGKYTYWAEYRTSGKRAKSTSEGVLFNLEGYLENETDPTFWRTTSYLLDMTPGSKYPKWWGDDQTDSELKIGKTYTDHWGGFRITPTRTGGVKGTPSAWIEVDVEIF